MTLAYLSAARARRQGMRDLAGGSLVGGVDARGRLLSGGTVRVQSHGMRAGLRDGSHGTSTSTAPWDQRDEGPLRCRRPPVGMALDERVVGTDISVHGLDATRE